jgi:hypothetical protein
MSLETIDPASGTRRITGTMLFYDPPNGEIIEQFQQLERATERRMVAVRPPAPPSRRRSGRALPVPTARRRELRSQLDLISGFLRAFPSLDEPRLSSVLGGYFNDLRDLSGSRVRALAAEISAEAGHQAAVLEEHATWLINLVRDIRLRGPTYDWSVFPKEEYKARVRSALDACERLSTEVESRETQRPDSDGSAVSAVRGR